MPVADFKQADRLPTDGAIAVRRENADHLSLSCATDGHDYEIVCSNHKMDGFNGIVCGRGGCRSGITGARECEGRQLVCGNCKGAGRIEARADEYDVGTFGAVCMPCRGTGRV